MQHRADCHACAGTGFTESMTYHSRSADLDDGHASSSECLNCRGSGLEPPTEDELDGMCRACVLGEGPHVDCDALPIADPPEYARADYEYDRQKDQDDRDAADGVFW